ncbi:phosphate/sulfate permease [Kordia periserrulae]|uniref:Phosphate transporter n=1 Tax=Kordia periserrulae TaxID=701523 RepID=A0A2T6C777_9FLAO|nr:inorganic phosphate transporter [Kordia periserrulae]PTX64153.1 phosphate/sulfate permease [Kordia periserrulae]
MDNIYLLMIIALTILAIADLVVGVSNDAVNFLNSAIGSKAISFKTIMIVASVGVAVGAIFSSGLMEVARKGIFTPEQFHFHEIMIIFMAVMITDILLLDFFNTLGMPTSTTVSIVFELLGAAVAMALITISKKGDGYDTLLEYINTSKATEIIVGILLSVVIAFTIGAVVQWFSRLLLSYNFNEKARWIGALFGGFALTAITYFIFVKGIKGTSYANKIVDTASSLTLKDFLEVYVLQIVTISFVAWSIISYGVMSLLKVNIYKLIIVIGTFALALAFAGNDLVNFIGVPIAGWQAFEKFMESGFAGGDIVAAAKDFEMGFLGKTVETPTIFLVIAGFIMVITLWFSSKAKAVVKTSIDLSSQEQTKERFRPNSLSRGFVRASIGISTGVSSIIPNSWQKKIDKQFATPPVKSYKNKKDIPAFDMVRAAVNLMVASVLISIATSMKLPLSTTYVTFMVAMGTSLADRAWGAESAVYRVAGVLNVIGGWFFTAIVAFLAAGLIAFLLNIHLPIMLALLLSLAAFLLIRNYIIHNKKAKEAKVEDSLKKAESSSVQGVIHESADTIGNVLKRGNRIYTNAINGLAKQDLNMLKKNRKNISKLSDEIDELRDNIFFFIKNLDEASSVGASNFYINILGYLQDITQSLEYISKASLKHVNNNHKKLKFNQIKELKQVDEAMETLFNKTKESFDSRSFEDIEGVLVSRDGIFELVQQKIQTQVERTRTEESSPKNTTLYFSLLLETKDLLNATMNLLEVYYKEHDSSVEPATIKDKTDQEE